MTDSEREGEAPAPTRACDNCGTVFTLQMAVAPHKRFCSPRCGSQWHTRERQRAVKALRAAEAALAEKGA